MRCRGVLGSREIVYKGIDSDPIAFSGSRNNINSKYGSDPLVKATCICQDIRVFLDQPSLVDSEKYHFVLIRKPNPYYYGSHSKDLFETVFDALPNFMSEKGVLLVTHFDKAEYDAFFKSHGSTIGRFFSLEGVWSSDSEEKNIKKYAVKGFSGLEGDTFAHAYTLRTNPQASSGQEVAVTHGCRCVLS